MKLLLLCLLHASAAALQLTSPVNRRTAILRAGATALPLFGAGKAAHAITAYAAKDFKDGKYVGPSVVGAAPTAEDEEKLEELYNAAVKKQEKEVAAMGFDLDDGDRRDIEMMVRTQYCGFQAKLKCKGSPPSKMTK